MNPENDTAPPEEAPMQETEAPNDDFGSKLDEFFSNNETESASEEAAHAVDDGFLGEQPDVEPDVDPETEAETEADVEPDVEAEAESDVDPEASPEEPSSDTSGKRRLDSNDTFDAETIQLIKDMSNDPHAGIKFAEVRGTVKELKSKLAEFESGAINTPEMQELKVRAERVADVELKLEEASQRLAMLDYQSTGDYQQRIEVPFTRIANDASMVEKNNGLPEGAVLAALSNPDPAAQDKALNELIDTNNISRRDELRLYQMAEGTIGLREVERELRENSQERLSEYREREASHEAYMREQESSSYRKSLHDTFKRYEGKMGVFLEADGSNKETWGEAIKNSESLDFSDPELKALGAYALSVSPLLVEENRSLAAEVAKLKAVTGRQNAVKPPSPLNGGGVAAAPTSSSDDFFSALDRKISDAGLAL